MRTAIFAYLLVAFIGSCIKLLESLIHLDTDHPRLRAFRLGDDLAVLLGAIGLGLWEAWLLWGGS